MFCAGHIPSSLLSTLSFRSSSSLLLWCALTLLTTLEMPGLVSSCQVCRLPRWQGCHALEIKAIFRGLFSLLVLCYLYFQFSPYFPVVWLAFKREGIPLECGWAPSDTVLSALLVLPAPPEARSFIYLNTSDFFLTYSHPHSSSFYFLALPQCI